MNKKQFELYTDAYLSGYNHGISDNIEKKVVYNINWEYANMMLMFIISYSLFSFLGIILNEPYVVFAWSFFLATLWLIGVLGNRKTYYNLKNQTQLNFAGGLTNDRN